MMSRRAVMTTLVCLSTLGASAIGCPAPAHADFSIQLHWKVPGSGGGGADRHDQPLITNVEVTGETCATNPTKDGFVVDQGGSPFGKCTYNKTWVQYSVTVTGASTKTVPVRIQQVSDVGSSPVLFDAQCSQPYWCAFGPTQSSRNADVTVGGAY